MSCLLKRKLETVFITIPITIFPHPCVEGDFRVRHAMQECRGGGELNSECHAGFRRVRKRVSSTVFSSTMPNETTAISDVVVDSLSVSASATQQSKSVVSRTDFVAISFSSLVVVFVCTIRKCNMNRVIQLFWSVRNVMNRRCIGKSRSNFGLSSHVGDQGLRNYNGAVALLEVFQDCQDHSRNCHSST